jgi:hypothetical protein
VTLTTTTLPLPRRSACFIRNSRWRGVRLLPYIVDFLFLATTFQAAVLLRDHIDTLLDLLDRRIRRQARHSCLPRHRTGLFFPTRVILRLGIDHRYIVCSTIVTPNGAIDVLYCDIDIDMMT